MCDFQYHMEALRKQRVVERKREAARQMQLENQVHPAADTNFAAGGAPQDPYAEQRRATTCLPKFRVNEAGHLNRYRAADQAAFPHMERMYTILYSGTDNSDYTRDENRNNRRENVRVSKYSARSAVNGAFDMNVHLDAVPNTLS